MQKKIEVYISDKEIEKQTDALAIKLKNEYFDKDPILIVILKGAFVFAGKLILKLDFPLSVDFMVIKSYDDSTESSGMIRIEEDITINIENRHVIVIEDIVDTGQTVNVLMKKLQTNNPKSLKLATLLDKPSRRKVDVVPDFSCFEIEDKFVVGFGLDYAQQYRNLPFIGILTEVK